METKYGFTKMTIAEFETWLTTLKLARTVLTVQQHHTWSPGYTHFKGTNHFELQKGMKNHHVNNNGWSDIGQHFTSFPDGTILTGRSLETTPACIYGQNSNSICIEHLGNFDNGGDDMTPAHKETIVRMTAKICSKFSIPVDTNKVLYHHWFDLGTGQRNNGTKNNKSCPGTNFFGGNKVEHCIANFLPLVQARTKAPAPNGTNNPPIQKYVCVNAATLNVRTGPGTAHAKATDRQAATLGAILRVFESKNGWYRISGSQQHWVAGLYTIEVRRATVNADTLNVRSGPGINFPKLGAYTKGYEVFICKEKDAWCQVSMDEKWVSKSYLTFA